MNLTYTKSVGILILKRDGIVFGKLVDCECCWIYEGVAEAAINDRLASDMSLREMLREVRAYWEDDNEFAAQIDAPDDCDVERIIEANNSAWAEQQTALDALHGM